MLEVEHHVELLACALFDKAKGEFRSHHRGLADGHAVVIIGNTSEFAEVFVKMRSAFIMLHAAGRGYRKAVGQTLFFRDESDNVLSEAVNAHVEPETDDILYFLAHLGVIHIEVGLLLAEKVQIPLVEVFIIFPAGAGKGGEPVVGRFLAAWLPALAPEIVVMIRIITALFALLKPLVLIGGVVDDEIHNNLQPTLMGGGKQLLEFVKGAVFGVDIPVIRYVIPEIVLR